jgi:hypothetical protein
VADPGACQCRSAYVSIRVLNLNAKDHNGVDELGSFRDFRSKSRMYYRDFRSKVEHTPATPRGVKAGRMGTVTACTAGSTSTIAPCSEGESYKAKWGQWAPPAFRDKGCYALIASRLYLRLARLQQPPSQQTRRAHEIGAWLAHAHRTSAQLILGRTSS